MKDHAEKRAADMLEPDGVESVRVDESYNLVSWTFHYSPALAKTLCSSTAYNEQLALFYNPFHPFSSVSLSMQSGQAGIVLVRSTLRSGRLL